MADKGTEGLAEAAKPLTQAQKNLIKRQQELQQWRNNSQKLRGRNVITGLTIGAFVLGMFTYTILSVKQERIMDEIDEEAKVFIMKGPRTGANS
ncbi:cytochrome C oxidase assembly factor 3b [Alosa pseudoharengus]|uniref:cytochrome c oxidase assembly factor 3 homolog, mitochondrial n=1 Tax=Alosa sapidissima TaxID=34773 RepID=UPI001C091CCD|nr:cytochrome c oxidase assembly factor 3 homolog, mitochondrial [Alosa sapidissima]